VSVMIPTARHARRTDRREGHHKNDGQLGRDRERNAVDLRDEHGRDALVESGAVFLDRRAESRTKLVMSFGTPRFSSAHSMLTAAFALLDEVVNAMICAGRTPLKKKSGFIRAKIHTAREYIRSHVDREPREHHERVLDEGQEYLRPNGRRRRR